MFHGQTFKNQNPNSTFSIVLVRLLTIKTQTSNIFLKSPSSQPVDVETLWLIVAKVPRFLLHAGHSLSLPQGSLAYTSAAGSMIPWIPRRAARRPLSPAPLQPPRATSGAPQARPLRCRTPGCPSRPGRCREAGPGPTPPPTRSRSAGRLQSRRPAS